MKSKLLFVTKDMGAAKAAIPVAKLARECGHVVTVFAEGKSITLWKEAGFKLAFEGVEFPDGTQAFLAETLIKEAGPDVVITTTSSPCFIENEAGLEANVLGIPLVFIEDFWAGYRRLSAKPDLVITLDEYAKSLVIKSGFQAVIAGNPSVVQLTGVPEAVGTAVESLRQKLGKVYVYAGGSPEPTTAELALLIECLKQTPGDWCLIPRFHPKHAKAEKDGRPYQEIWDKMLAPFGERIVSVPVVKSTDDLAEICDATFAAHSLCLIPAVKSMHGAVSLWTEASQKSLEKQGGLIEVPLVALGLPQIREAQNLNDVPAVSQTLADKLQPFDPEIALQAILGLMP